MTENSTVAQLLSDYASILDELRDRQIVRSANNPLSDYAELLFCNAYGWEREGNSASGHDAIDTSGARYQIKARRITPHNRSRQLSAIRNLDKRPFDFLAGLLVDQKFKIIRAALIPISVIDEHSSHVAHTNSWKFLLRDNVWQMDGVVDVSDKLRAAARELDGRCEVN
jgi:hypothetical protein